MSSLWALVRRNSRLYFKDKGVFLTSLITPVILLVLYVSFLGSVYRDAFQSFLPQGSGISSDLIDGCVGGQLLSSLLAVCCVTVTFCANMLMVTDKVTGAYRDLTMTPVKSGTLALSYYLATYGSALMVNLLALGAGLIYLAKVGWYLSAGDVGLLILDVALLVLFGTALSSLINRFLSSQGQVSAVGTIVSSGYGFICGAYMPISNFAPGLQKVLSFLPGTYATSLLREHAISGAIRELEQQSIPAQAIDAIRDYMDCNVYFFDNTVGQGIKYAILVGSTVLLTALFVLLGMGRKPKT